jgi:hypothetical protein
MERAETSKPVSKPRLPEDTSFGHGSMGCAVFLAIMVLYWLLRRLSGATEGDLLGIPFVLGIVSFGFGHILAITALFSKKSATSWWGRTALVTMWASILVWLFAGIALGS